MEPSGRGRGPSARPPGGRTGIKQDRNWLDPGHISYCDRWRTGSKFFGNHSSGLLHETAVERGPKRMAVILLVLGIVVAAAGVAAMGFGIPINEFTLGTTLILTGATALTGGLILIALSAVVSELGRLAEGLRARPVARSAARPAEAESRRPVRRCTGRPCRHAHGCATAGCLPAGRELSSATSVTSRGAVAGSEAARALSGRGSVLGRGFRCRHREAALEHSADRTSRPQGRACRTPISRRFRCRPTGRCISTPPPRAAPPRVASEQPEPKAAAEEPAGAAAVEALKASRLDFLFRSKPARPAPESFEAFWPADGRPGRLPPTASGGHTGVDQVERQAEPPPERRAEPPPPAEPRTAAVLKSGVVDGMAYTLYADGSIEAKLPHGTVKFGSITELRAHIENNS